MCGKVGRCEEEWFPYLPVAEEESAERLCGRRLANVRHGLKELHGSGSRVGAQSSGICVLQARGGAVVRLLDDHLQPACTHACEQNIFNAA